MRQPVPPKVRPEPAAHPSPEVARARELYLLELRRRVEDGSYFTDLRVDTALRRMLRAIREDLPDESDEA